MALSIQSMGGLGSGSGAGFGELGAWGTNSCSVLGLVLVSVQPSKAPGESSLFDDAKDVSGTLILWRVPLSLSTRHTLPLYFSPFLLPIAVRYLCTGSRVLPLLAGGGGGGGKKAK